LTMRTIPEICRKMKLEEAGNDFAFWQSRTPEERLAALEEIRKEYNTWKYGTEPGFQRVYRIVALKNI